MDESKITVGASERKVDGGGEAFADIQPNRTLLALKLSQEAPYQAEMTRGLKTVNDVFNHFNPTAEVAFEQEDGSSLSENLNFKTVGDFGPKGIANGSKYLKELGNKEKQHMSIVKELKSNSALQAILKNKDTKGAFMDAIQAMIKELEDAGA